MKNLFSRGMAILLTVLMLSSSFPAFAFAVELSENPHLSIQQAIETPVFNIKKVNETTDTLVVAVELKSGIISCFDGKMVANENLTCTKISLSDDLKAFRDKLDEAEEDSGSLIQDSNVESGIVSVASSKVNCEPMELYVFTYTKAEKTGVVANDLTFTIGSCYVNDGENDIEVTPNSASSIPATHAHVASGEWVKLTDGNCITKGTEGRYCSECGELAETRETTLGTHSGDTYEERVEPKCTEDGYVKTYCSDCKELLSTEVLPQTGHLHTRSETKDPTCTEDGWTKVICTDCGETVSTTPIPATGHQHTKTETKDPTCTEDGWTKVICTDCGETVSTTPIPATGHQNTRTETKDPTCTEDGWTKIICDDCGETISTTPIPATGHQHTRTETKDPTCTEDGWTKVICDDCGETISTTPIPATGHQHTRVEQKAPTCTEEGYIKTYCTDCGDLIKTQVLKATGHKQVTESKAVTCTEDGYIRIICTACKEVLSETIIKHKGHVFGEWRTIEEPTYRSTGLSRRNCTLCSAHQDKVIPMVIVKPTGIVISMESFSMNYKQFTKIYANVVPEEAAYSADIVWSSSNIKVATVDSDGNVHATGRGTAIITATAGNNSDIKAECKVTIKYSTIQWIIMYLLFGWIWY